VVATLAPVAVSLVLWILTSSPFALVFAALGPVVAVASVVDGRLSARRTRRRESARRERETGEALRSIRTAHERERDELDRAFPSVRALLALPHDPDRWQGTTDAASLVLGRGSVVSGVRVEGADDDEVGAALRRAAESLDDAPLVVPAHGGVGFVGARAPARAAARGLVVQLARALSPADHELVVPNEPPPDSWLTRLPHPVRVDPSLRPPAENDAVPDGWPDIVVLASAGRPSVPIALARSVGGLPSGVRTVVVVDDRPRIDRADDVRVLGPVRLDYVSEPLAAEWAMRLAALAERDRLGGASDGIPNAVRLDEVLEAGPTRGRDDLTAIVGVSASGPLRVDLVGDGPHAVIGGTTGSGKSELLVSWALALAAAHAPLDLSLLLVDFKGGASFAPLTGLPHVTGLVSDLDARTAQRALESLSAEVRARERAIADAGVRSIAELAPSAGLPRLVILVDEFAAMVHDFPELHAVVADVAARGRSLGMHLVLCTQRPAGIVRDAVLANVALRMSLRVHDGADSTAVLGTDAAARLPAAAPGRVLVSRGGEEPVEAQVPMAAADSADRIAARWSSAVPPSRRPWLDPLPDRVGLESLPAIEGIPLGRSDLPEEQSQPTVAWRPERDGALLILGGPRSGRSTALQTIAAHAPAVLVDDPEAAWDAVHDESVGRLLIDDLDAIVARLSDEHSAAFVEALAVRVRQAAEPDSGVALTAQRVSPAIGQLAALCGQRIVLRMPSRQEHVLVGEPGERWRRDAPPGRATWRGVEVQIAMPARDPLAAATPRVDTLRVGPLAPIAVVTSRPRAAADRVALAGIPVIELDGSAADAATLAREAASAVLVGDVEAWQAAWGALPLIASRMPVVFEGCTPTDLRTLLRTRGLPPPIVSRRGLVLIRNPDGALVRARLEWPETEDSVASGAISPLIS
jgi:S-DNA-T family DNA segregation ATPase FtsK/SpoIIIE